MFTWSQLLLIVPVSSVGDVPLEVHLQQGKCTKLNTATACKVYLTNIPDTDLTSQRRRENYEEQKQNCFIGQHRQSSVLSSR